MDGYNVTYTSAPVPKMNWEEIKAELASLPEPTFCIDCGQPTTPGKGSARCQGCWQDRCQGYDEDLKEVQARLGRLEERAGPDSESWRY